MSNNITHYSDLRKLSPGSISEKKPATSPHLAQAL